MASISISESLSEADRRATHAFLVSQLLGENVELLQKRSLELNMGGVASILLRAEHDGVMVGAAYIGPGWEEINNQVSQGNELAGRALLSTVRELHAIAVAPEHRNMGLGSRLLAAAEQEVSNGEVRLIVGVASEAKDRRRFYERHGYTMGDGGRPLLIRFQRHGVSGIYLLMRQQNGHDCHIAKHLVHFEDEGRKPVRALHASDDVIARVAASTAVDW